MCNVVLTQTRWQPLLDVTCFKEVKRNFVVMPNTRRTASANHSEAPDTEEMLLRFIALLNDDVVLNKLTLAFFPEALTNKSDADYLTICLNYSFINSVITCKSFVALKCCSLP